MKLQIDTENRTITIEENINLGELFDILGNMFPQQMWRQYTLQQKVITTWVEPFIPYTPITLPYTTGTQSYPWIVPTTPTTPVWDPYKVTCGDSNTYSVSGSPNGITSTKFNGTTLNNSTIFNVVI